MVLGAFWTWFNDQFLAVVTLALVGVTAQVAAQTRASVRAAVQPLLADVPPSDENPVTIDYTFGQSGPGDGLAVEVQERALFHVDVRQDYYGTYYGIRSVALRNIGNGPALIENVELAVVDGKDPTSSPPECWRSPRIVPRDEIVRLMARVPDKAFITVFGATFRYCGCASMCARLA